MAIKNSVSTEYTQRRDAAFQFVIAIARAVKVRGDSLNIFSLLCAHIHLIFKLPSISFTVNITFLQVSNKIRAFFIDNTRCTSCDVQESLNCFASFVKTIHFLKK